MKEIRMVVTDLDDTLLGPNKEIPEELFPVLAELDRRGVVFTFITGRPQYAVERFADRIGLHAPLVTCNGAILCDVDGGVMHRESFPLAPLRPLLCRGTQLGFTVLVFMEGVEYALGETQWTRTRKQEGREIPIKRFAANEWECATAEKANIIRNGAGESFRPFHSEVVHLREHYSIALYGDDGCEIVAGGVNKATGLTHLCAHVGIPVEQVLAVGDNENDVELLRLAGIGAAVANGSENARRSADYVCKERYTAGVIEAVRAFVLGQEVTV